MSWDTSGQRNATPRSNRPYDVSNSFVRRVASRVSGLFGGLFSTPDRDENTDSVESRLNSSDNELPNTQPNSNNFVNPASCPAEYEAFRNHLSISNRATEPVAGPSGLQQAFGRNDNDSANLAETAARALLTSGPSGIKRRLGDTNDANRLRIDEAVRAGPSGFTLKHRDEERFVPVSRGSKFPRYEPVEPKTNTEDNHSESSESTSGCSSLVPQSDRVSQSVFVSSARRKSLALDEKLNYARQLKQSRSSLYLNRSIPIIAESPRPSRTPSFDISAYGKPILNKSVRENMLSSPFYTGQTTYGGASARRSGFTVQPSPRNIGSQIAVKPASEEREGANMSQTARRILSALEELSTPLNDAKRIPTPVAPLAAKRRNIETRSAGTAAKRPALEIPTVADLLKLRRLQEIQDSTTMARQVTVATREPSPPRWTGKIVTKKKDRGKPITDPPPPPPELPKVALQFSTLPKFDLPATVTVVETATTTAMPTVTTPSTMKKKAKKEALITTSAVLPAIPSSTCTEFPFASPSAMASDWSTKPARPVAEFTFSTPPTLPDWLKPNAKTQPLMALTPDAMAKLKRKPVEKIVETVASPVKELSTGSVMDILSKTTPVAEKTATNGAKTLTQGFGDKFKQAAGSWSCSTCLVTNSAASEKCVACETPKIGDTKSSAKESSNIADVSNAGFGDKFKPVAGSWICDSCMVNNVASVTKCVACESVKPGSEVKAKPSGSWTCSVCLITNKDTVTKCAACESPQPNGPLSTETKPSFSLSLPPTNCTFKFGIDQAAEPISNGPKKEAKPSASTFTFGNAASQETLKRGIDEMEASVPKSVVIQPALTAAVNSTQPTFSFGIVATSAVTSVLPSKPTFTVSSAQPFSINGPALSSASTEIKSFSLPVAATAALPSCSHVAISPVSTASVDPKPLTVPFCFGASNPVSSTGFKFNKPCDDQTLSVFRFGATAPAPAPPPPSRSTTDLLSQPALNKATEPGQLAVPAFGSAFPSASNTTVTENQAPVFTFGRSAPVDTIFGPGTPAFSFGRDSATPAFHPPATGFGTSFAALPPVPAFGTPAAPTFPATVAPSFGTGSGGLFGASNTQAFALPSATVTPFGPTSSPAPTLNFAPPAQPAYGQNSASTFPPTTAVAATLSPFQFNAGGPPNPAAPGPLAQLSVMPSFQFNVGRAPDRRPIIRAKRRNLQK